MRQIYEVLPSMIADIPSKLDQLTNVSLVTGMLVILGLDVQTCVPLSVGDSNTHPQKNNNEDSHPTQRNEIPSLLQPSTEALSESQELVLREARQQH